MLHTQILSFAIIHHWRGRRVVWAPHPAAHIKPGEWVDAVVAAVRWTFSPEDRS